MEKFFQSKKQKKKERYRFIVAKKNIKRNEKISFGTVAFKRLLRFNKNFLPADYYWKIKDKKIIINLKKNKPIIKSYLK